MSEDRGQFAIIPRDVADSDAWCEFDATAVRAYVALAVYADQDGVAWPGITTLAAMLRCSRRNAQRAIRRLEQAGFLDIEQGGGRAKSSRYRLRNGGATRRPLRTETVAHDDALSDEKQRRTEAQTVAHGDALSGEKGRRTVTERAALQGIKGGAGRLKRAAHGDARSAQEQHKKQQQDQPRPATPAAAAADALAAEGIGEPARTRLAEAMVDAGFDAESAARKIRDLATEARAKSNGNATGLIIRKIEDATTAPAAREKATAAQSPRLDDLTGSSWRRLYDACLDAGDFEAWEAKGTDRVRRAMQRRLHAQPSIVEAEA